PWARELRASAPEARRRARPWGPGLRPAPGRRPGARAPRRGRRPRPWAARRRARPRERLRPRRTRRRRARREPGDRIVSWKRFYLTLLGLSTNARRGR